MSVVKKDRVFPIKPKAISDTELAQIVARALRKDFGDTPSAVKHIGRVTNANLRAIKNWYEARNTPSSGHLLLLARSSPSILKFLLEQVGGEQLWDAFQRHGSRHQDMQLPQNATSTSEIYTDKFVSINVSIDPSVVGNLNQRQLWFIGRLQQNYPVKTEDISNAWQINPRTAWRDVGALVEMKIIQFTGAKKTGRYILMK
jgi:hypothetical protein